MRSFLAALGRVLLTGGLLLLLFVAYQLWGTGVYQDQAQHDLERQFQHSLQTAPSSGPSTTSPAGASTTTTPLPAPSAGDAVASLRVPKIGLEQFVIEGVGVPDLRRGPGHYPTTALPGQAGNAAIAGHRTTYGAPFGDLDQLAPGDDIYVRTAQGSFHYRVIRDGVFVVKPTALDVLDDEPDPNHPGQSRALLTLTTCNPKYSASQRLIVRAELVVDRTEALPPTRASTASPRSLGLDLSGESSSRTPTILWGFATLLVGLAWWLWFHRHPGWWTWLLGAVPFLVGLFFAYTYLERLLPANY